MFFFFHFQPLSLLSVLFLCWVCSAPLTVACHCLSVLWKVKCNGDGKEEINDSWHSGAVHQQVLDQGEVQYECGWSGGGSYLHSAGIHTPVLFPESWPCSCARVSGGGPLLEHYFRGCSNQRRENKPHLRTH